MVSVLDSESSGLGSSPDKGHCVVLLGNPLYSPSASSHLDYEQSLFFPSPSNKTRESARALD